MIADFLWTTFWTKTFFYLAIRKIKISKNTIIYVLLKQLPDPILQLLQTIFMNFSNAYRIYSMDYAAYISRISSNIRFQIQ